MKSSLKEARNLLKNLRCPYFLCKVYNSENLNISHNSSSWILSSQAESIVNEKLNVTGVIVLIFNVNRTNYINGLAITCKGWEERRKINFFPENSFVSARKLILIKWLFIQPVLLKKVEKHNSWSPIINNIKDGEILDINLGRSILNYYIKLYDEPNESNKLSWEDDIFKANPALTIFPIDLTKMTYEGYCDLYDISREHDMNLKDLIEEEYYWESKSNNDKQIASEISDKLLKK